MKFLLPIRNKDKIEMGNIVKTRFLYFTLFMQKQKQKTKIYKHKLIFNGDRKKSKILPE